MTLIDSKTFGSSSDAVSAGGLGKNERGSGGRAKGVAHRGICCLCQISKTTLKCTVFFIDAAHFFSVLFSVLYVFLFLHLRFVPVSMCLGALNVVTIHKK